MELVMKTDLGAFPKAIEYNHEELKQQLAAELEKYQNIIVTVKDISSAKADRANLNKFRNALEAKRKEIKTEYLQPYEAFERQIKEIVAMVDKPIKAIDNQIKFFENQKKEEKRKEIEQLYWDEIGELKELVPLEKLWNGKWLNATCKLADIGLEIETAVNKIRSGMQIIKDLHCDFEEQIMDRFLQTLDINTALMENKRLETQKKQLEAVRKQREELQKQRETALKQREELQQVKEQPKEQEVIEIQETKQEEKPEIFCLDFRVWATREQIGLLKGFLIKNNIKYGKVPKAV